MLQKAFRFSALLCFVTTMATKGFKAKGDLWPLTPSLNALIEFETRNCTLTKKEFVDIICSGHGGWSVEYEPEWPKELLLEFIQGHPTFMVDSGHLQEANTRQLAQPLSSRWGRTPGSDKVLGYGAIRYERYSSNDDELLLTWSPSGAYETPVTCCCLQLRNKQGEKIKQVSLYYYNDKLGNRWYGSFVKDSQVYTLAWYNTIPDEVSIDNIIVDMNRLEFWERASWLPEWTVEAVPEPPATVEEMWLLDEPAAQAQEPSPFPSVGLASTQPPRPPSSLSLPAPLYSAGSRSRSSTPPMPASASPQPPSQTEERKTLS